MTASFHRPSDLRSLALTIRGKARNRTLTLADVARYCERIEANADEWQREQRTKACLPLFAKLGLAIAEQAPEVAKR